ncbi:MAG TPA: MlaD family protein [Gemmatimonadaceae bacterium]|jgi:phospholipid/cholesterol/gamma-HCH transport system substrate-binding protein|nr:MlaD family protein [Gemmatimonadaceae bacterium]
MKRSSFITWDQLKVGGAIVVALGVLTVAMYKLGQATNLFHKRYQLTLYLPDASGLRNGTAVFLAGQFVGAVQSIDFLPVDNDTLRNLVLKLGIDESFKDQIRTDSHAKVRSMGLLGDKVIDISVGTPKAGVLAPGGTLPVVPSVDYDAVLAQAAGAVTEMVALTHDLREITGGIARGQGTIGQLMTNRRLYDQFVGTMARADQMLSRFENPNGSLGRLLDDPTLYDRFVTVIGSADSLVVSLNDKNGTIGKLLRDDTLYTHIVNMAVAGDSLMKSLSNGKGTASRMLNDPALYDRLNKLTTDLGAILDDIQKDPHKYFKGVICVFHCK